MYLTKRVQDKLEYGRAFASVLRECYYNVLLIIRLSCDEDKTIKLQENLIIIFLMMNLFVFSSFKNNVFIIGIL